MDHPNGTFVMDVPYLIGRTNDEGGNLLSQAQTANFRKGLSEKQFRELVGSIAMAKGLIQEDMRIKIGW